MATHRVFNVARAVLERVADASELFPPIRAVAQTGLDISGLVERFRGHKAEWQELSNYIQNVIADVVEPLSRTGSCDQEMRRRLEKLKSTLDTIADQIETEQTSRRATAFGRARTDLDTVEELKTRVKATVDLFNQGVLLAIMGEAAETPDALAKMHDTVTENGQTLSNLTEEISTPKERTSRIEEKTSKIDIDAFLNKLRRVTGASWDPLRACLEGTRSNLIEEIIAWASTPNDSARGIPHTVSHCTTETRIIILTGVAGSGKTTIAHTIAQRCSEDRRLASSFFFDRGTDGRNTPVALFTTIAADLSGIDPGLAKEIATTIKKDESLISAPISRQFGKLVLEPCKRHAFSRPMLIVVDGLDEAWDDTLFEILRDQACNLPDMVRIFLTPRMRPELDSLCQEPHVRRIDVDITAPENIGDISNYTDYRLTRLAKERRLGSDWPGETVRAQFLTKADGLFLWVATVCDFLRKRDDVPTELGRLINGTPLTGSTPDSRMDRLYACILESFDWTDESFVAGYQRLMGTAIASRSPMTISTMKALYHPGTLASNFVLQNLSPLLTGTDGAEHDQKVVRVLHQSLREFLVTRCALSPRHVHFAISEKDKNMELALLCLNLMNQDLSRYFSLYFTPQDGLPQLGVPRTKPGSIPKALWYACQFWQDHLKCSDVTEDMEEQLRLFMRNTMITWMEAMASCGRCPQLEIMQVMDAAQLVVGEDSIGWKMRYSKACLKLSERLENENRLGESLTMAEHGVEIRRQLAIAMPATCRFSLAASLDRLSGSLFKVGNWERALTTAQEAVDISRRVAGDQSIEHTHALALTLNTLSNRLSNLSRHEEALNAIEEAVDIHRCLSVYSPDLYSHDLAISLSNLSERLSDMGRHEKALSAMQEAVDLQRHLAVAQPAAYKSYLATSLRHLSVRLGSLGRYEDALAAVEESVELYRSLPAGFRVAFNPELQKSLSQLSRVQHLSGQFEESEATFNRRRSSGPFGLLPIAASYWVGDSRISTSGSGPTPPWVEDVIHLFQGASRGSSEQRIFDSTTRGSERQENELDC
ncbi:hypothetical protein RhiJN_21087 [Ceratobasidium sp. AG-Ba]|nr:hypothetical protein RhiJN_21087 [Ceratobasidium sp. AG-Ba]